MIKLIVRPDPPDRPAQVTFHDILVSVPASTTDGVTSGKPVITHVGQATDIPAGTLVGDAGNWAAVQLRLNPTATIDIVRTVETKIGTVELVTNSEGKTDIVTKWGTYK